MGPPACPHTGHAPGAAGELAVAPSERCSRTIPAGPSRAGASRGLCRLRQGSGADPQPRAPGLTGSAASSPCHRAAGSCADSHAALCTVLLQATLIISNKLTLKLQNQAGTVDLKAFHSVSLNAVSCGPGKALGLYPCHRLGWGPAAPLPRPGGLSHQRISATSSGLGTARRGSPHTPSHAPALGDQEQTPHPLCAGDREDVRQQ